MENLPTYPNAAFPAVPVIAEDDPVEGGIGGVDNRPHEALAERTDHLKARVVTAEAAIADHGDRLDVLEVSDAAAVARALGLFWLYNDEGFACELFAGRYVLRDVAPLGGVATVAGDDSVDVSTTAPLRVGEAYAIATGAGLVQVVQVAEILSSTRFRAASDVAVTVTGGTLSRTTWTVGAGFAVAAPGSVYLSQPVDVLRYYDDGRIIVRRDATDGALTVASRAPGGGPWVPATLLDVAEAAPGTRDEIWSVNGGPLELRIDVTAGPSAAPVRVDHIVVCTAPLAGVAAFVQRPAVVAPAAGAVSVGETPTITGTAYRSLYGIAQADAQFQVSTRDDFATLVLDELAGSGVVAHTVSAGALSTDTVYFCRLRYKDADGNWSAWSAPAGFTTSDVFTYIRRPLNVAPAAGATGVAVTPTLQSSPFGVAGGADAHAKSQWRVATDAGFTAVVYDSGEVADLTNHAVPTPLSTVTTYYFSVRHKGAALGWSEWSTATPFTVQARAEAPLNGSPAAGATGVSVTPTLQVSAFFILGGTDTHVKSQYQIATDAGFTAMVYDSGEVADLTSHAVSMDPDIAGLTLYYWRARHKGAATGWGAWSAPTSFTTVLPAGSQLFNVPGIYQFYPPAGVTSVMVKKCIGGGGGGGDDTNPHDTGDTYGANGGGGGIAIKANIPVTPGVPVPVTVGVGGARAQPGGSSSFGVAVTATGGKDGDTDNASHVGANGVGIGGDVNLSWVQSEATINGVVYGAGGRGGGGDNNPGVANGSPGGSGAVWISWGNG
ncbi:hypothetical protein [Azospirillum sp.]|uniref:glycine-rich domain-containing protein n=1 Tax=Azospirillum sp. TaxID=34012 RepID=UPI002D4EA0DD|nr:hypothetical protein [Azospirillum sp.]HYD65729.1 hypothetical protein [Azospirillum sp.]